MLDIFRTWRFELAIKLNSPKTYFCTLFRERRAVLTPKTKPVKPGFLSAHKPGFSGLKIGELPGFSGTRVPGFHSLAAGKVTPTYDLLSRKMQQKAKLFDVLCHFKLLNLGRTLLCMVPIATRIFQLYSVVPIAQKPRLTTFFHFSVLVFVAAYKVPTAVRNCVKPKFTLVTSSAVIAIRPPTIPQERARHLKISIFIR